MTIGSENSSRLIFDKLVQKDLHGMLPSVSYFTSASLARLDPSAKKDAPTPGGPLHCVLLTLVIVCFNRMVLLYFFF